MSDSRARASESLKVRRLLLVLLPLTLLSCVKEVPKKVEAKVLDPIDGARAVIENLYKAVEAGDADLLETLFADDALVFGLGPSDTWQGGTVVVDRRSPSKSGLGFYARLAGNLFSKLPYSVSTHRSAELR